MTHVISAVQQKGGAGKTTLLAALASLMASGGVRVAVIDTDPQGHLEAWAKKGAVEVDWLSEEDDERLIPVVKSLKQADDHDVILIDTAGFKSAMAMHAIAAAQLVLIPSKASEADARGARRTWSHVQSIAETMDRSIPAAVVLTDVDLRTVIARAITRALDSHAIPRLKTVLSTRTGFREMASTGKLTGTAREAAQAVLDELYGSGWISFKGDR
ncbi:MAG: ParA family protein [Rhodobacteraceae bacterium]|nr:ParA family protein [Paracoccaceae bacterium]